VSFLAGYAWAGPTEVQRPIKSQQPRRVTPQHRTNLTFVRATLGRKRWFRLFQHDGPEGTDWVDRDNNGDRNARGGPVELRWHRAEDAVRFRISACGCLRPL
jgi:hypothetical protein